MCACLGLNLYTGSVYAGVRGKSMLTGLSFTEKGANEMENSFGIVFYVGDTFPHCVLEKLKYVTLCVFVCRVDNNAPLGKNS